MPLYSPTLDDLTNMAWFNKEDFARWQEGRYFDAYRKMGAHRVQGGVHFSVWAPHADVVSVIGDFNNWNPDSNRMERNDAGIWTTTVQDLHEGAGYKFRIRRGNYQVDKTDPYAFRLEPPTGSGTSGLASIVTDLSFDWSDDDWMRSRPEAGSQLGKPISIYEVHLGSWRRKADGYSPSYREIAEPLADHVERLGFTHVELLPVQEHPYYGSWGYQVVGFYAPTFRYGQPEDLMYLVNYLHQRGIGVILDWVPAHFAPDPQGLIFFDGSNLYEYEDERMRNHPDWGTYVFDYNKPGVKNFLISNALYWLDEFHIDGLRFDAVASMLYRDYSRDEWTPNMFGGRENLEAIDLLKAVNEQAFSRHPGALMIAEESTAWPGVSAPTYNNGLGFLFKWNMGWMHDTLTYLSKEPVHRRYHHGDLTFPFVYAFSEHYALPLSHDEVVHGKGSLWDKMPGDPWQKAANLRLLYGHMFGSPGKKLLFMGCEFGQTREWNHDGALDWHLLEEPLHGGVMRWLEDLNKLYREHPSLHHDEPGSFYGIIMDDADQSVMAYRRIHGDRELLFVFNFTPVPRHNYRIGVPLEGTYRERLNSDAKDYGGSGQGNIGGVESNPVGSHGLASSITVAIPPLGVLVLEREA
jgi:1,4-alpha-glucan branching enzyme